MIGTFPEGKTMPYKGEITKSSGSLVYEINGAKALDYFEDIGFIENGVLLDNFNFVPFAIDQRKRADYDGIPVMRSLGMVNEDGSVGFRGNINFKRNTYNARGYSTGADPFPCFRLSAP